MMNEEHYTSLSAFGSEVRLYIGNPIFDTAPPAELAALGIATFLQMIERKLTRFHEDSELCRLNADERETVPASALLRLCIKASLAAAERSNGLVDCTVLPELERAGYQESRADAKPAPLTTALAAAPPRRPARPSASADWSKFAVDDGTGTVTRPFGLRIDSGGVGKGLAADLAATRLKGYSRVIVDCGGDLRVRGTDEAVPPYEVGVQHPMTEETISSFGLRNGAIATSGLKTRIWRSDDGYMHHLIDPYEGTPAWTGLIQATALAPTALEAETLAKIALLSGPQRARKLLSGAGGVLVLDDGTVELFDSALAPAAERLAA